MLTSFLSVLQVHDMLQMLQQDQSSDRGSLTDSGRGASEEGDVSLRPSPMEDKPSNRDWKGRGCSTFLPEDKHTDSRLAAKINPHCPKHGKLAAPGQTRAGSFNISPVSECAKSTNCNPPSCGGGDKRRSYPGPGWPGCAHHESSDPHGYKSYRNSNQGTGRRYLSPDDLLAHREAESVDGMSDSGTTTSGSYVVDMEDVEEEGGDQGAQISADIIV